MRLAVIGAGAWGTCLANLAARNGHQVRLWARDPVLVQTLRRDRQNVRYLPGRELVSTLEIEADFEHACADADGVVVAAPSKAIREIGQRLARLNQPQTAVVSATKGVEFESGLTMCGVLQSCGVPGSLSALSGPTLAEEVSKGMPSAVVVASESPAAAAFWQGVWHEPMFRVYTSSDRCGVELGGALKNVIAIAAGVCDGLGFGDNSKAALVTRAIAEIRRLGVACGANAETFSGLSGLGDLTVTCFSKLSRNRTFGERLGRGADPAQLLATSSAAVEGYPTARAAWRLAQERAVVTPIIEQVHAMLYEQKDVRLALRDLVARESRSES